MRPVVTQAGDSEVDINKLVEKIQSFTSENAFDFNIITKSDLTYEFSVQYDVNDRQFSSYVDNDTTNNPDIVSGSNVKYLPYDAWDKHTRTVKMVVDNESQLISRQTKEYIKIPFGNSLAGLVTARLVNAENNLVISRVGFFDNEVYANELTASNSTYNTGQGVYIGYNGAGGSNTLFIGIRSLSASNDLEFYSCDWNLDSMDGNGISREVLHPNDMNTFAFIFGNINGASMRIGLYKNGKMHMFHELDSSTLFDYDCSLPIRMEIETLSGYSSDSYYMEHKNASVYSVEKNTEKPLVVSYQHTEDVTSVDSDSECVIASLRLSKNFIRSKIRIVGLEIKCESSVVGLNWILAINPHWSGHCSDEHYDYIDKSDSDFMRHSIAEFGRGPFTSDSDLLSDSQGYRHQDYIIASGTCTTDNTIVELNDNNHHYLLADMHGHPDVARVFLTTNTHEDPKFPSNTHCILTWEEYI